MQLLLYLAFLVFPWPKERRRLRALTQGEENRREGREGGRVTTCYGTKTFPSELTICSEDTRKRGTISVHLKRHPKYNEHSKIMVLKRVEMALGVPVRSPYNRLHHLRARLFKMSF